MMPWAKRLVAALTVGTMMVATACAGTIVPGNVASPTDLGFFGAGTYQITASGLVDLAGNNTFPIKPDGMPGPGGVTLSGYEHFNPNGSYLVDTTYGPGGAAVKIGALMGKVDSGAWFPIGYSTTVVLSTPGNLYAQVNDTYYANNAGSFEATVSSVPDTGSTAALLGAGVVALAFARRRLG